MRFRFAVLVVASAVLLAGCRSGETFVPPSETATPEVTATSTGRPLDILPTVTATAPPPTPTPIPPATASGLWIFDLGRGKQVLLYEGDDEVRGQIEPSGNTVTATVVGSGGTTARRFRADGAVLESHADRGLIVVSANGESRFYLDISDPAEPQLALEHQGEAVTLEATRPRDGVAFSPSGDRLLTISERPGAVEGEVVRTFSVHTTVDGRLRMQFEHRATFGSPANAYWSPSGRFVADEGIEGLFVRDTVSGRAWRLGPGGSAQWSALGDRLLAITDLGRLAIVDIPDLDGVDLGAIDGPASVSFDRFGRLAIVTTYADVERADPTTRAFDVDSGSEVGAWPGLDASGGPIGGSTPAIALDDGVAAVFGSASCAEGFVVQHPALGDEGRCLRGANPRWSPKAQFLVYVRERELVMLSVSSDSERVIVRGTPPAQMDDSPLLRWSADGSWILIQWSVPAAAEAAPAE